MYDKSGKLIDRREMLKIKLATLVFETARIRSDERKQLAYGRLAALPQPFLYQEMRNHRVLVVRRQARLTGIALGFIKGKALPQIEPHVVHPLTTQDWKEIGSMVAKYGSSEASQFLTQQIGQYAHKSYGSKPEAVRKTKTAQVA